MQESKWEKSLGDTVSRTQTTGQDGLFLLKYAKDHGQMAAPPNVKWSVIAKLGGQTIDLKLQERQRAESKHDDGYGSSDASGDEEVAVAGPGDEDEWDTSEWAPEDIKVAAATLVQEMMHEKCNAIRRAKAGELLARLASENEPARQYLESVIEDHVNAALRLPRFGEAPLNERSLYLVGSLGGVLQDKFSRIGVMYKAVAVLNYEHDLAARRLQHVWRRHIFFSKDCLTLDRRTMARRLMMLDLKSFNLSKRWDELVSRPNRARLSFAVTRDILLLLDGQTQEDTSDFVEKNRWKLVQSGGLPTVIRLTTHACQDIRAPAVSIVLSLSQEVALRSSLLAVDVQSALLDLILGEPDGGDDDIDADADSDNSDGGGVGSGGGKVEEESGGGGEEHKTAKSAQDPHAPIVVAAAGEDGAAAPGNNNSSSNSKSNTTASQNRGATEEELLVVAPPGVADRLAALEVLDLLAEGGLEEDPADAIQLADKHELDENTVEGRRAMIKRLARTAADNRKAPEDSDQESDSEVIVVDVDDTALLHHQAIAERERAGLLTPAKAVKTDKPPPLPEAKPRLTFYHERAARRRKRLAAGFDVREPFSEQTLAVIAESEAPIHVDGDSFFVTLGHVPIIERLVILLLAEDDQTVLGASMVLTKLAHTNIHPLVVRTILDTPNVLQSIVDLLHTPSECLSIAALLLLRELVAREESRLMVLKQGVAAMLLVVCKQTPHDSLPFILGLLGILSFARPDAIDAGSDPEPIDLSSTPLELGDALARTLLSLMTAQPREVAVCVIAIVKLGALSEVIRFLCGGFDFLKEEADEEEDVDEGSEVDEGSASEEDAFGDEKSGGEEGGDGEDRPVGVEEAGDEEAAAAQMEEEEEKWGRNRERRCIAAIVMERICQCDMAVEHMCDPRVLSFLCFILRGNRVDAVAGDMYGIEATSAELRVMHVANQAVCRTLNLLARSKTLSKTQRHRTAVAVLGLGAVPDIVDLIARSDPEVEADPVGDDTVEAALVLLATIMPKGEGDGDIEDGQIVRTIPEYLRDYERKQTITKNVRRASVVEQQMAFHAQRATAGETPKSPDAKAAVSAARRASIDAAAVQARGKAELMGLDARNDPSAGPNDPTRIGAPEVLQAVEAIAKPTLDLLVRCHVPTMRTTAMFTLARCCHNDAAADIVHAAGALNIVLGFFPATPLLLKTFPERVDMQPADVVSVSSSVFAAQSLGRPPSPISVSNSPQATLRSIPLTCFTLLAELARTHSIKPSLCLGGVFATCVQRFCLQTGVPAQDQRVQGELALFLARCASINVEDWGSTNDLILKDAKVLTHKHDLEHRSMSGGRVMIGLVQLLAERVHRRARYHAALCLGNLSDDFMRTVPAMVLAGVLPACVAILNARRSPHSLIRQVMRVLKAVGSFPMRRFSADLIAAGAVEVLTRMGGDLQLQLALPRFNGNTVADVARAVAHLLGEDVVDAARAPSHPRGSAASMAATNILPPPSPSHPGSAHTPSYWPGSPGGGGSVPPSASIWSEGGGGAAGYHHTLARTGGGAGAGGAGAGAGVPVGTTPAGADDGVDPSPTRVLRSSSSLSRVRMAASATARSQSAPLHADRVSGYHMGDQATPASRGGGGGASSRGMPPSYRRSGRMERDRAPPKGNVLKNLSKRGYTPAAVPQRQRPATNVSSAAIQASYNYLFDPVFDSGGSNVRVQSWQRDHKAHRRNQGGQLS